MITACVRILILKNASLLRKSVPDRLSSSVIRVSSLGYVPIKIRNGIVPIVNVCNTLSMPIFIIGLILGLGRLAMVGAILFGAVLVFQLVTLPTEINASRRAMKTLESMYLLEGDELTGARKTLTAAAMTYVAAVASTALQFLRLVLLANRRRD